MQFEWAVVLAAFLAIIVFVVWVVRRTERSDSRDTTPTRPRRADEPAHESRPPAATPDPLPGPVVQPLLPSVSAPPKSRPTSEVSDADEDETRLWSIAERERLLDAYSQNAPISELAKTAGTTPRAVVFELSRLLLEPQGAMVDSAAKRFGLNWDALEESTIQQLHSAGVTLPEIARKMQRDQLGIAFRLFEGHVPQVARHTGPWVKTHAAPVAPIHELPLKLGMMAAEQETPAHASIEFAMPAVQHPRATTIRQELLVPPETIVGGLDPDNDSDDNRIWSREELRQLLFLYGDNEDMDISDLARHLRTTSRAVVMALAEVLLEAHGQLESPDCPKRDWTQGEVDTVHDLYRDGASLGKIAHSMGRDQLNVAFRILGDRLPQSYGFDDEFTA